MMERIETIAIAVFGVLALVILIYVIGELRTMRGAVRLEIAKIGRAK